MLWPVENLIIFWMIFIHLSMNWIVKNIFGLMGLSLLLDRFLDHLVYDTQFRNSLVYRGVNDTLLSIYLIRTVFDKMGMDKFFR
jgi:hypothetical protein